MSARTFRLGTGGEYEFDRDSMGIVRAARRHGEPWLAGHNLAFSNAFNAALDRIEELEDALELIQHATSPAFKDGGHHEAAHEIAASALKKHGSAR